jgi:hypothetical protein
MRLIDDPLLAFGIALLGLWTAAKVGAMFAHWIDDVRDDFQTVMTATLTLLGLIVGFTFSMAVGRYDQRKNLEKEEANAIGTEYLRADLLPPAEGENVRKLLRNYVDRRISFYKARDRGAVDQIDAATAQQQDALWASVRGLANPTPLSALAVAGMNDVLNAESYTHAAWSNRIPYAAWALLILMAVCSNVMVGLSLRNARSKRSLIFILPFIVSVSLLLIADLDAPRGGLIHVEPQNLIRLAQSINR